MPQARAEHDTRSCGGAWPRCPWAAAEPGCGARGRRRGQAGLRGDAPSEARSAGGSRAGRRPWAHKAARPHRCGGRRRDLPRCRWAAAGPGRHHTAPKAPPVWRAPEGPEGTGGLRGAAPNEVRTPSLAGGRALRRPEHQRRHKQQRNTNARQPERATARSRSQWSTQRSRAATTSATWTAFRAAPLRRLSPETTRMRPRLPSTAWS